MPEPLYLALSDTLAQSGWGVATENLTRELGKITNVVDLRATGKRGNVPGSVLHAVKDAMFNKLLPVSGYFDAGYCFFESYVSDIGIDIARQYDLIFTGSTYNTEILESRGLKNVETLIQGIDPNVFNPIRQPKESQWSDWFVIFSGGKFEMRKGQDVVLAAMKVLQEKYRDIFFVNAWENKWPNSFATAAASPYIRFKEHGNTWTEQMAALYALNRMPMGRCLSYPLVSQRELRNIIRNSDLGIFLSRCEGGTNLALMEYMACGKPVVATNTSGHRDILTEANSFQVRSLVPTEFKVNGIPVAMWDEPDIDEVIATIEYAYLNRDKMRVVGEEGAKTMRKLTWERTARQAAASIGLASAFAPKVFKPQTREEFGTFLNELGLTGHAVEVGVQRGEFSEKFLEGWDGSFLHLVDRWTPAQGYDDVANVSKEEQDANFRVVQEKLGKNKRVNIVKLPSLDAARLYPNDFFDFIYLDADHSYEGCKADIEAWWPKLRRDGVMAGHDYIPDGYVEEIGEFGVRKAVLESIEGRGLRFYTTQEDNWRSWWVKRTV